MSRGLLLFCNLFAVCAYRSLLLGEAADTTRAVEGASPYTKTGKMRADDCVPCGYICPYAVKCGSALQGRLSIARHSLPFIGAVSAKLTCPLDSQSAVPVGAAGRLYSSTAYFFLCFLAQITAPTAMMTTEAAIRAIQIQMLLASPVFGAFPGSVGLS